MQRFKLFVKSCKKKVFSSVIPSVIHSDATVSFLSSPNNQLFKLLIKLGHAEDDKNGIT